MKRSCTKLRKRIVIVSEMEQAAGHSLCVESWYKRREEFIAGGPLNTPQTQVLHDVNRHITEQQGSHCSVSTVHLHMRFQTATIELRTVN